MALSTYSDLWRAILLRCPAAGGPLAQQWITYAFREVWDKRKWSWKIKRGQFTFPNQYTTGTATVTNGSAVVTGSGTAWASTMVGQQFRIGLLTPIYDIASVQSATQLTLADVWGAASNTSVGYQIYTAYVLPPTDFHSLTSIYDPNFNWQLWTTVTQAELNTYDAQRASQGTPYVCADFDYTSVQIGGAAISPSLPRFEIWPHQTAQYVIPFLYESVPPDLNDSTGQLPRYIQGNILLEGALAQCARWPGPSMQERNAYFNLQLANEHEERYRGMVREQEVRDDEIYGRDVSYGPVLNMPFAPLPFPVNAAYMQVHAI